MRTARSRCRVWGLLCCSTVLLACGSDEAPTAPQRPEPAPAPAPVIEPPPPAAAPAPEPDAHPRFAEYRRARESARGWLDRLDVDAALLRSRGIKGVKKLAEILDAYLVLHETAVDDAERTAILARARELAAQTAAPAYHELGLAPAADGTISAMSYLRAAWVMDRLGLDTAAYRARIVAAKTRMDELLSSYADYRLEVFALYYDHFGLEKPPVLRRRYPYGVIEQRLPMSGYASPQTAYDLTHLVFYAFNYGYEREQTRLDEGDAAYVASIAPGLMAECIKNSFPDLLAELLSCMTYVGRGDDPAARRAVDYLLENQNPDGSWGRYEILRPRYGEHLEHEWYLHTTLVSLRALAEAFETWPG